MWELPRERLEMYQDDKLGSGAFSIVYKGAFLRRECVKKVFRKGKINGEAPVLRIYAARSAQRPVVSLVDCDVAIKVCLIF